MITSLPPDPWLEKHLMVTVKGFLVAEEQEELLRISFLWALWVGGDKVLRSSAHLEIRNFVSQDDDEELYILLLGRFTRILHSSRKPLIIWCECCMTHMDVSVLLWLCSTIASSNQQVSLGLVNAATPSGADFTKSVLFALANSNRKLSSAS